MDGVWEMAEDFSRPSKNIFVGPLARRYDEWYSTPWGNWADTVQRQLFIELAQPRKGERVLDVGCGTGRYLKWLLDRGTECIGVDISLDMLSVAAERLGSQDAWRLVVADACKLPFADKAFDLSFAATTFEFLSFPAQALAEMARVTRSRIFIGVLNRLSPVYLYERATRSGGPLDRAHFYTIAELRSLARQVLTGWDIQIKRVLFGWPFTGSVGRVCAQLCEIFQMPRLPGGIGGGYIGLLARRL